MSFSLRAAGREATARNWLNTARSTLNERVRQYHAVLGVAPKPAIADAPRPRLFVRLFTQVERVMKINGLSTITDDVIEAARSTLVIGIG
jgi:hypothetical protein